ncbi:MAG: efflux RND transporter periplasmic adaptor subunit [Chromatiaceae bacterium]|nr:MAG: efflux RND transporter periplasmic adaptor subunit [Chromatiaceae bacterium]
MRSQLIRARRAGGRRALLAAVLLLAAPSSAFAAPAASGNSDRTVVAAPAVRPVRLTGFTRARAHLPLVSETAGRVATVNYDIGDPIGSDASFARIDDTFIRLELEQVQVRQDQLRSRIAYDRREADRYRRLARENAAAAAQLDIAEQALQNNEHELRQQEVQQRILEERLRRTRIPAPCDWQVTARHIEPGQWIGAGEPIGAVADFSTLIIPFALSPEQYGILDQLAAAGTLTLQLPDGALATEPQQVAARIHRVNPDFDTETRKIAVEVALVSDIEPRRGGLRAVLELPLPEQSGAVLLPETAIRRSLEEAWVEPLDAAPLPVVILGRQQGPDGPLLRVSHPAIAPGDRFRLPAGPN